MKLWVSMFSDVTALAQLSHLKTRMIRMASHDLKNPLSRVLGYSELMLMDDLGETHKRFLEYIMSGAHEMNRIITEILNLEQLRSQGIEPGKLDFAKLTREVISRHEPDMVGKSQIFRSEVGDDPIYVYADHQQLGQVNHELARECDKIYTGCGRNYCSNHTR